MDSDAEGVPSEFFDYFKVNNWTAHEMSMSVYNHNESFYISGVYVFCHFMFFQVLCIQGFLTCRKHAERIILLVEMLQVIKLCFQPLAMLPFQYAKLFYKCLIKFDKF